MHFASGPTLVLSVSLILAASDAMLAQEEPRTGRDEGSVSHASQTPSPTADSPAARTGKERLGKKWMDEQRLDNCKIPPDKRGTKPRPDACPTPSAQ
jgi:hypothetical protein